MSELKELWEILKDSDFKDMDIHKAFARRCTRNACIELLAEIDELENTRTQSQCDRVKQLELALNKLEVGSCKCLTKTNEYQYHAEFCPTRIIGEALNQLTPKEQGQ